MNGDASRVLSSIPLRVIMVHNVQSCYMYKIGDIKNFELRNAYDKLCDNGALKEKNILVAKKGLTHALAFPKVFKVEWIKIVLSRIHDMKLWIEKGPIKITK